MKIAILTGGTGLERDVALRSAKTFCDNIAHEYDYFLLPEELDKFLGKYKSYSVVIPVFHGEYGEDGQIFGLLENLGIKYCFSSFKTHALCMDKSITNILADRIGLSVPRSYVLGDISQLDEVDLEYPLIVKPNSGGSSIATYRVENKIELKESLENVFKISKDLALVQEFITGTEYSVPIIGNSEPEVLPIMRVELKSGIFFDYEEKYNNDGTNEIFGEIEEKLKTKLTNDSVKLYKYLNCRGFSRIDYMVNDKGIYFLEVNTIPGFSAVSIFPKARKLTGRTLPQIVDKIIELGLE